MSIVSEIERIKTNINNAYDAIEDKGVIINKKLPDEYVEVEYIESTGSQWIDTEYIPNQNTLWENKIMFTDNKDVYAQMGMIYKIEDNNFIRFHFGYESNSLIFGIGKGLNTIKTETNYDLKEIITSMDGRGNAIVNNKSYTSSNSIIDYGISLYLFSRNSSENYQINQIICKAKLYYSKIYDNDILVRNFIPCYRVSDNEIGLYDLVSNTFFTNQGTGTFIKGNDIQYIEKNSENLASSISKIESKTWSPDPDWWDIDKILEEDTEDYPAKMICLLSDVGTISSIYDWNASKIKMSDGVEYVGNNQIIQHTWDRTKDKDCSLGYKTRFVIYYFDTSEITRVYQYSKIPEESLYCIFKNMNVNISNQNYQNGVFQNRRLLQYVKCIDTVFTNFPILTACTNLVDIEGLKVLNYNVGNAFRVTRKVKNLIPEGELITNTENLFYDNTSIDYVNLDFSKATSLINTFYLSNIKIIENLDISNVISASNPFSNMFSLVSINHISSIRTNGFNFTNSSLLNYDTLIRILNALFDYSDDTENTHTITFGATNLAKLTEEEIAIGTNKGWTIS